MGMSIEEIIKSFDYIKHVGNGESTYEHCREEIALDEAVAIMHKYQKIQKIIDDWENSGEEDDPINIIDNIEEVLEDGNDSKAINK